MKERLEIGSRSVEDALKRLADVRVRLEQHTRAAGLPVSDVAGHLRVSEPTVRAWLRRALVDYLHDRGERAGPALGAGLEELRRGDVELA